MPLKQRSKHIVTSARGKRIDFEALRRSNETVRAVGNVPVNARGDEIGPNGKVIKKREEINKSQKGPKNRRNKPDENIGVDVSGPGRASPALARICLYLVGLRLFHQYSYLH